MSGQTDLAKLIASLQPELQEGVFVFVSQGQDCPVLPDDLAPILRFQEQEGWAFIVEETKALRAGFDSTFRCRLITLKVHSSLEAVGLLAAVTTRLAAAGISVNAVSAFYHDHLFVAPERARGSMRYSAESDGQSSRTDISRPPLKGSVIVRKCCDGSLIKAK